jgi:hypothetical protein
MTTKFLTYEAIYQKYRITKRRLKYARKLGYITNVKWNEKRTKPRFDPEEVKEHFGII